MCYRCLFPLWVLVIFLGFIFAYLRYIEQRSLFYPDRGIEYQPKDYNLDYQDAAFKAPDNVELSGWFLPAKDSRFTILFCHGNAGNISHRLEKAKFFHQLGCNVFLFDYRGYGKSKGNPSESGLYLDVQGAYDYLLAKGITADKLIGYGESLGGAVIIHLAARHKLAGLIVESSFTSASDMIKIIYPFIPHWIFSSRWDSATRIKIVLTMRSFLSGWAGSYTKMPPVLRIFWGLEAGIIVVFMSLSRFLKIR
ncbi:MAG: alpha/beta hydrolase [Candidatus Omnitrophica bacterium]|nr:alpha/beta hydrolase [Candidatus Omnitrophota bacterium]